MDKVKETLRLATYRSDKDLEKHLKGLVSDIENFYKEFALRINSLLTNPVEDHIADDTLTKHETDSVHTNFGATGTITLTLPTVTRAGVRFTFAVQAVQELRIDPGAATIKDDSGQTADKYKTANAIGECLQIISGANGDWYTTAKSGTWTEEA